MIKRQKKQSAEGIFLLPAPVTLGCTLKFVSSKITLTDGIEIVQVDVKGVVLDVPAKLCSQGEKLKFAVVCESDTETLSVEFSAMIRKLHCEAKSDRESIEIDFIKFDREIWARICSKLSARQSSVLRIFEAIQE